MSANLKKVGTKFTLLIVVDMSSSFLFSFLLRLTIFELLS